MAPLAPVDTDVIQLLDRWRSDVMYLHVHANYWRHAASSAKAANFLSFLARRSRL
jgi:hypothetical protein